jgi:hypothetical protein
MGSAGPYPADPGADTGDFVRMDVVQSGQQDRDGDGSGTTTAAETTSVLEKKTIRRSVGIRAWARARPLFIRPETPDQHSPAAWRSFVPLLLVLCTAFATACQQLDENLASGPGILTAATSDAGTSSSLPPGSVAFSCDTVRSLSRASLVTNCAYCHQAPGNSTSVYATGLFNFILELDKITTLKSNVFTGVSYVAAGDPDKSLIYQRASNGTMPPAGITRRPGTSELALLRAWITNCVDGSSVGWPPAGTLPGDNAGGGGGTDADAAVVAPGCGDPGQPCCAAGVCNAGGCCVANLCRGNGLTCTALPTQPGAPPTVGLSGTCTNGSCETAAGVTCGNVNEPCCDLATCTASQSSCLMGMTTCSACGGTGQPCCKPNGCLDGQTCLNGGVGRIGTCGTCGGAGQPCCGAGMAAQQRCDPGLTCSSVPMMGNLCSSEGGDGGGVADGGAG